MYSISRESAARLLGADQGELAICAALDPDLLRYVLAQQFDDWRAAIPYRPMAHGPGIALSRQRHLIATPDRRNAMMMVRCSLSLTTADDDYPAFRMACHLFGASTLSRLWRRLREQDGLTYAIGGGVVETAGTPWSLWQMGVSFAPQNRARVEQAFDQELVRAHRLGFSEQELRDGKLCIANRREKANWLKCQPVPLGNLEAARRLLSPDTSGEEGMYARLDALTLEPVNQAFVRYLDPERMVRVFAGDF